jgi:1-acylglycerone phosphate reductase
LPDLWMTNKRLPSTTPWNGLYSAAKAAVKSMSEAMAMELQPLNIQVLHVAPGSIISNIASNATASFVLAPDSLWSAYLPDMVRRINASQGPNAMPSAVFARKVVGKALSRNLGFYTYLSEGGNAALFRFLRWLPRTWVLRLMWKTYSKKA